MDSETPTKSNRKTGPGSRIKKARLKGAAAANAGIARDANNYERPNMRASWFAGHDSVTGYCPEVAEPDASEEPAQS